MEIIGKIGTFDVLTEGGKTYFEIGKSDGDIEKIKEEVSELGNTNILIEKDRLQFKKDTTPEENTKLFLIIDEIKKRRKAFKKLFLDNITNMSNEQVKSRINDIIGDDIEKDPAVLPLNKLVELEVFRDEAKRRKIILNVKISTAITAILAILSLGTVGVFIIKNAVDAKRFQNKNGFINLN